MSSAAENETHNNGGYTNRGLKKGPWLTEEDEKLKAYVTTNGVRNWNSVSKNARLERCGKSCRLRWYNHLHPDVKKGRFSKEEEAKFFELLIKLGGFKWSEMALQFPGRSDNAIKNFWNARIRKYRKRGLSPYPHNTRHADVLNENNPRHPTLFSVPNTELPNFVADSNLLYFDVGSNHTAPTSIDVGDNGTSHTPMTMVSDLPPLPQCSYIQTMDYPSSSHMIFNEYSQILSPEETQDQMFKSNFPDYDGLLESIFKTPERGECSYATPMCPSEMNLVDERGKKPISEMNLVDERGKKPISLENDVEANHGDLIDTDFLFDYNSYDNDNKKNLHDKIPNNVKDTLDAVTYGKNFHK